MFKNVALEMAHNSPIELAFIIDWRVVGNYFDFCPPIPNPWDMEKKK